MLRETAVTLTANFALLTAFLFFSNRILRRSSFADKPSLLYNLKTGVLHGLFGVLLMFFSVRLDANILLDYRQIAIIAAAHFGGLYASLLSGMIIALGRVSLFGGVNPSAVAAVITALTVGASSGLISRYVQDYWKKWILSIFLSTGIVCGSLFALLEKERALHITPGFIGLMAAGGLFSAYLIRYLWNAGQTVLSLRQSEERYRQLHILNEAVFQSATEAAIIVTDESGKITRFNSGAERMLGYKAEELTGKQTPVIFHSAEELWKRGGAKGLLLNPHTCGFDMLVLEAKQGRTEEREWTYTAKKGNSITVNLIVSPVKEDGDRISGYLFVATDITQKKQTEERLLEANKMLQQLSLLDGLTQIPNRRSMDGALAVLWEQAALHSQSLSFIMIDIDYFKSYNDTYGHLDGDQILKQVAKTIQSLIPSKDLAARYGGEEFAVVLCAASPEEAEKTAGKIRAGVEQLRIQHAGSKTSEWVTVSLGIGSIVPYPGAEPRNLISMADKALYRAKQEGRNRVAAYTALQESV